MGTNTTDDRLRFGVVGAGNFGMRNARNAAADPRAEIVGVADVSPEAREAAVDELGPDDDAGYADHEALFEGADLDAVVITTPHTLHYDQLTAAVDAGIHVLCEKPLVTGVENAVSVVELDREVDTVIMPGYQRHLQPAYVAARGWWRTNADAPTGLASSITQDWIDGQAGTWRVDPDLSGGGFLYDTGSHVLDALLWITGLRPAAVSAEMTFTDDDERVDSAASLLIDFETDVSATVTLAGDVHEVYEHHQFWTDGAGLRIEGEGWAPRKLETFTPDWRSQPRGGGDPSNKVEAFVDAVLDGTEPPATTFDALQTTAVTEAAYEAARTGDRVPIEVDLDAYAPE